MDLTAFSKTPTWWPVARLIKPLRVGQMYHIIFLCAYFCDHFPTTMAALPTFNLLKKHLCLYTPFTLNGGRTAHCLPKLRRWSGRPTASRRPPVSHSTDRCNVPAHDCIPESCCRCHLIKHAGLGSRPHNTHLTNLSAHICSSSLFCLCRRQNANAHLFDD